MALDKVKPLKLESPDTGGTEEDQFPTSLDPSEDFVECRGLVLDDATHFDESTVIERSGNDLRFKDGNNPSGTTLSNLLAGGGFDITRLILTNAGSFVYVGDGDIVLKV